MGKGWTSDDPSPDAQKRIDELKEEIGWLQSELDTYHELYERDTKTICRLSIMKTDLEKMVKKLENDLVYEKGLVDLKSGTAHILAEKVAKLEGEVKYWSELARLSSTAHQNAVAAIVHSAEESNKVIHLWYERSIYAKKIIWKLIAWIRVPPGKQAGQIAESLPKWVRKEAWGVPSR